MTNLAIRVGIEGGLHFKIHTPLIEMTKRRSSTRAWNWVSTTA